MALRDITGEAVREAVRKFDDIGLRAMLSRYGGGTPTRWYVCHLGRFYDQKLLLRAAHHLQGLGHLPPGRGTFTASEARRHLQRLGFEVGEGNR